MRALVVSTVLLPVLVAGCGHRESVSQSSTAAGSTGASPATTQAADSYPCAPQGATEIKITRGVVVCSDAYAIAAKYHTQGEKVPQIDTYKCETGTADTRPLIIQCVSDTAEFGVYPAP